MQAPAASLFIVDLPTGFDDEQKNDKADEDDHADRDQKCLHDGSPGQFMTPTIPRRQRPG
jgi:hypothetical protein